MKLHLTLFSAVTLIFSSALSKDGFSSGDLYASKDKSEVIGRYVSLTADGDVVYRRTYFKKSKDKSFSELFIIKGKTILDVRHLNDTIGFIFCSDQGYIVSTSVTHSMIDKIMVTSIKDRRDYVWKRDPEGFYTDFQSRSMNPPRF
jgi:hypothetical protein